MASRRRVVAGCGRSPTLQLSPPGTLIRRQPYGGRTARPPGVVEQAGEDRAVLFFKDAGKFKSRYPTLGFEDAAKLDDGPIWPTTYALTEWTPAVEEEGRRPREGRHLVVDREELGPAD